MQKWIVANWKTYGSLALVDSYKKQFLGYPNLIVCPPAVYLSMLAPLVCGGQNTHFQRDGAYTGEISAIQLKEVGAAYCIVGHSERRKYFKETNQLVKEKSIACIENGIIPIICIGEELSSYENKRTQGVLKQQLEESVPPSGEFWVAYEPVWAIGTGKTPTLQEIESTHRFLQFYLPNNCTILYGGSVNLNNFKDILQVDVVKGVLVGGASLDSEVISEMLGFDTSYS